MEKGRCRIFYQMNGRTGRVDLNETANFFALRAIQGGGERNQELKDGRIGWGPGRELMRGLQYFGEIVANLLGAGAGEEADPGSDGVEAVSAGELFPADGGQR